MEKVFVVILASFNLPCYEQMVRIRIAQMQKRNIRFHFIFNGPIPPNLPLSPDTYTHIHELGIEKYGKGHETYWVPETLQKFLQTFLTNPINANVKYILRLNVSTFVSFDKFLWMLQFFPTENLLAGPFFVLQDRIFCNGTAILLSRDVAHAFAFETVFSHSLLMENDDVAISWSLMDRYTPHDTNYFYRWIEKFSEPAELQHFFEKHKHQHTFFRVKSAQNRDIMDPLIWTILYQIFG